MATTEKLSAKEVATQWDTNARTVRKFFRSDASGIDPVGQGNRYALTQGQVTKLAKKFEKWVAEAEKATDATDAA